MGKRLRGFCLILGCFLSVFAAMAQQMVSGIVTDAATGEPLIGASIVVKSEKNIGTVTNEDGKYKLRLPESKAYTLVVTYIGYVSQQYDLEAGKGKEINFKLEEDAIGMETVVVTGTRTPKLLKDVPIVTRVITSDDIRKVDATNIQDLLQIELPGIEFSYSMDQQTSLNMQGFGGNAVLFLVDGERLAGETLDNIDYSRLNLDNVERIEIVKGAASSLYGSNAVGGVVNIITRESTEPWTANVNARYGAHDDQRYGGAVSFKAGKFNNTINVQHTTTDPIELFDSSEGNKGDYNQVYGNHTWNFKERLVYNPNDRLKLTARAGYFFKERDKSASDVDRYRDYNAGLKGNYIFNDKNNLELAYAFDQYDKSGFDKVKSLDIRDYSNVQNSIRALYNYTFSGKNTVTVGGDYMTDYLMSYQFTEGGSHKQYTADGFVQFDLNLSDRFNVTTGLRYDYFSEADVQNVSSKLGIMYKWNNCSLRASYAGGFRAPTLKEMYMNFDMANIFMIYGNENLKPEESQNFSLSAEYIKSRYNVTITGYYNLVDNRITTAWDQELKGMVYTNISEMKVVGVDVNAAAKYPCGIGVRLSYAYTHEHIAKGEPILSSTRPHTATARLEYDKSWKKYGFNISLNGRIMSKVTTDEYTDLTSYEETERVTYPGYTMWKLNFSQRIWEGININMTVDNLFNYKPSYYYSNSPSTTGTTFSAGVSIDIDKLF